MKPLSIRLKKLTSGLTIALLLVNPLFSFAPVAYASEEEALAVEVSEPETTPVEQSSEINEPVESVVPEATVEPIPVPESIGTPEVSVTEGADDSVWQILPNGKALTREAVNMSTTYVAPHNSKVTVRFTKLPDTPGNLTIQEIKLTPREQAQLGSLSSTVYDISSSMENETFKYNLTLPSADGDQNAKMKYTENIASFDQVKDVTQKKSLDADQNIVTISGLNHFTVFFASADTNSATGTGAYTATTGPSVTESSVGEITLGTIILTVPEGFEFDTAGTAPTVLITRTFGGGPDDKNINNLASGTSAAITSMTTSTITFTVTDVTVGGVRNSLTWQNIRMRPTAGTPLASGDITKSGTSTGGSFALNTFTEQAGAVSNTASTLIASPSSVPADGTTASIVTATITDQFGNPISGRIVTLAKTSGAGSPVIGAASGASDVNGQVTFSVTSTTPAVNVFTATIIDSGDVANTATITFVDTTAPETPVADNGGGDYYARPTVSLSSNDPAPSSNPVMIYYTIDGSTPDSSSTLYAGPFEIANSLTLKAIAYDAVNNASPVMEEVYVIAPIISNVSSSANTNPSSERVITWTTDINSTSQVVFGTMSVPSISVPGGAPNYGYVNSSDEIDTGTGTVTHTVTIGNLNSNTTYFYRVVSSEALENVSDEHSFGTEPTQSSSGGGGSGGSSGGSDSSSDTVTTTSTPQGQVLGTSTKVSPKIASIPYDIYIGTPYALSTSSGGRVAQVYGITETAVPPVESPSPSVSPEASPIISPEATQAPSEEDDSTDPVSRWSWWYLLLLLIAVAGIWYFMRNRNAVQ